MLTVIGLWSPAFFDEKIIEIMYGKDSGNYGGISNMANLLVGIVTGLSYIGLPMMVLADGQRNGACNCRHQLNFPDSFWEI